MSRPIQTSENWVWDTGTLAFVPMTQPGGGGGGGGDASAANQLTEIAALGNAADAEAAGNGSIIAILKRIRTLLSGSLAVTGTFWQATQPVSAASLPLPTGAATEATLDTRTGSLTEAAPASDTASSGLNGRLQRIAQNITTLIGRFAAAVTPTEGLNNSVSTTQIVGFNTLFNGLSWDREHGNWRTTTGDTGTKTATFNSIAQTNFDSRGAWIVVVLGTVSGTTPTMSIQLQATYDGTNYVNIGPAVANLTASNQTGGILIYPTNSSQTAGATPANLTIGTTQSIAINAPLPRNWRLAITIGGTTPSFALTSIQVQYLV